jgi:hypothetical protein
VLGRVGGSAGDGERRSRGSPAVTALFRRGCSPWGSYGGLGSSGGCLWWWRMAQGPVVVSGRGSSAGAQQWQPVTCELRWSRGACRTTQANGPAAGLKASRLAGRVHALGARYDIARADAWLLGPAARPHDLLGAAYAPAWGRSTHGVERVHNGISTAPVHQSNARTARGQRCPRWAHDALERDTAASATQINFAIQFSKLQNSKKCQQTWKSPKVKVVEEL